ncbi:MAG: hypothetical protein ABW163_03440 [Luteimonas sp.]
MRRNATGLWLGVVGLLAATGAHAATPRPTPAEHWQSDTPQVFVDGTQLHYYGRFNEAGAERLRAVLSDATDLRELHIASPGGDGLASIDIGTQIQARDLAVVVVGEGCASGCANYVFTPARQRTIAPGSVVFWHYSCPPRKPERRARIARRLRSSFDTASFRYKAEDETGAIEDPAALRANFEQNIDALVDAFLTMQRKAREGHTRIYDATGIDDRIICLTDHLRLPEVPERHVGFMYTLSVEDMARFGVCDVRARPDYAAWAERYIAADDALPEYAGVVRLSDHPRFRPRPARPCGEGL